VAPTTELEQTLCAIWSELLHVERIGIQDDFFTIGGNSLLVAKMAARVRRDLDVDLALRNLFMTPTIVELAAAISLRQNDVGKEPVVEVQKQTALPVPKKEARRRRGRLASLLSSIRKDLWRKWKFQKPNVDQFDVDSYLEIVRPVVDVKSPVVTTAGTLPVVIIGDARPMCLMREVLPPNAPVLHLLLDGVQVWPPVYLSFEQQVEVYVRALEQHLPERRAAIVGFSYGGTLAHRLASILENRGWNQVSVMLIEPTIPDRYVPTSARYIDRWRRWKRRVGRYLRGANFDLEFWDQEAGSNKAAMPDLVDRWDFMEDYLVKIAGSARLSRLKQCALLVGSEGYLDENLLGWQKVELGNLELCQFAGSSRHLACFEEPYLAQWLATTRKWYAKLAQVFASAEH
jgi:thioesterase domain-containing protein